MFLLRSRRGWQRKHNPSKTELLSIPGDSSPRQDLVISLDNSPIPPSVTACNLGVTMDNQLSCSSHNANLTRLGRFLLYNISRIRPFLSTQAAHSSFRDWTSAIHSWLVFLRVPFVPLQLIQNPAADFFSTFSNTTLFLRSLHWLPVATCIRFKTRPLAYKAKNGPEPAYLKSPTFNTLLQVVLDKGVCQIP